MRRMCIIICCVLTSGCATTENYEIALNTWIGSNIVEYISSNGSPNSVLELPNKNVIYTWDNRLGTTGYAHTTKDSISTPYSRNRGYNYDFYNTSNYSVEVWCKTDLMTDSIGKIIHWTFDGNACRQ